VQQQKKLRGLSVLLGVELGRFAGMMFSLMMMSLSGVRVVRGFLMIAFLMMTGGFAVMAGGVFVVLSRLMMMLR